ncbi:MAG: hypothetical protein R2932_21560 [Caldilineaceae bacterium]
MRAMIGSFVWLLAPDHTVIVMIFTPSPRSCNVFRNQPRNGTSSSFGDEYHDPTVTDPEQLLLDWVTAVE